MSASENVVKFLFDSRNAVLRKKKYAIGQGLPYDSPDDLAQYVVDHATKLFEKLNYDIPDVAAGKCYDASEEIIRISPKGVRDSELQLAIMKRMGIACAEHPSYIDYEGDIAREITDRIRFTNHFAVVIDRNIVVDYTLRQFDGNAPYPFVGSFDEWGEIIAKRWEVTPTFSID